MGHFVGTNLSFSAVRSIARSIWLKDGLQDVLSYGMGFFLFRFASKAGMESILESGPWLFPGRHLVLLKWRLGLELSKATLESIPVWAQFYNIPIELWTKGLSRLASAVGRPLYADSATEARSRVNFAIICIEVDASRPLVEEFDVEVKQEDGSSSVFRIGVSFQWKPPACTSCKVFGHSLDSCAHQIITINPLDTASPMETAPGVGSSIAPSSPSMVVEENDWQVVGKKGKVTSAKRVKTISSHAQGDSGSKHSLHIASSAPLGSDSLLISPLEGSSLEAASVTGSIAGGFTEDRPSVYLAQSSTPLLTLLQAKSYASLQLFADAIVDLPSLDQTSNSPADNSPKGHSFQIITL